MKPTNCPNCKSRRVKMIVYGLLRRRPFWQYFLPRNWVGRGCCIYPDSPAWYCAKCKHEWGNYNDHEQ